MKIAVCIKQVPDSWAEKKMAGGVLDRANVDAVLNDLDEYAVEEALRIVEANSPSKEAGEASGHTITLISMGPERATEAIRKALSMGADDAILIRDALPRPPRGAGVKLTDEGSGGEKLVEFLVEKRLA
ncbi:MAG: hypothetical protein EBY12_03290 [Actinobacteria bacterium]|nr:hypothetical protein [Actinomycetota bacterium]